MKFIIQRELLLPSLQIVNGVIERRHTLPVLSNLLMSIGPTATTLTGTDMEVELISTIEMEAKENAEFTLPARKLLDICKAIPEGATLDFTISKDQVMMKTGKSRFTLMTLPANEFPATEISSPGIDFTIPQKILKSLLQDTMFAMAQQDVRYYLNGLLIEVSKDKLRSVATDGHRLALKEIEVEIKISEPLQVIVPRKGVSEAVRLLGENDEPAQVQISQNHIRIIRKGLQFTSKLIDGRFPDYERVIPKQTETPVIADREALRQSLTRASILSNEKYKGVRIILKSGNIKAHAHNPEQEEAEEELEVEYIGREIEIGFNVSYLLDALNAIKTDKVVLTITDPNNSCLLLPSEEMNCKYVVMPMRL
ncbi:MAG: DNA polymerase III subunit beta [Gammaproteobacteria bacterium]|nr:DNA polymerase III subunit beta [Gammaproteobacteria bacterium]